MAIGNNREPAGTMAPQPKSPLFRLPPELRNTIYEMALTEASVLELKPLFKRTPAATQPPRLRACRATRAEALPIFHSKIDSVAAIHSVGDEKRLQHWLTAIGPHNRVHLRHVLLGRGDYFSFVASIEGFRRARSRFLRWLKYSGERDVEGEVYFVVKLGRLTFDD